MALAPRQIVPAHDFMVEFEAPVRPPPLRFEPRAVRSAQRQGGPVIDRRQASRLLALALAVELLGGLVTRIKAARGAQPSRGGVIKRDSLRLAQDVIGDDAKPGEIDLDRLRIFFFRSFHISVIEAKNE